MIQPTQIEPRLITDEGDLPPICLSSYVQLVRCVYLDVTWQLSVDHSNGDAVLSTVHFDNHSERILHVRKFPSFLEGVTGQVDDHLKSTAIQLVKSLAHKDFIFNPDGNVNE